MNKFNNIGSMSSPLEYYHIFTQSTMLNRRYCFNTCQISLKCCLSINLTCILSGLGNQRVYANLCALSLSPPQTI